MGIWGGGGDVWMCVQVHVLAIYLSSPRAAADCFDRSFFFFSSNSPRSFRMASPGVLENSSFCTALRWLS